MSKLEYAQRYRNGGSPKGQSDRSYEQQPNIGELFHLRNQIPVAAAYLISSTTSPVMGLKYISTDFPALSFP